MNAATQALTPPSAGRGWTKTVGILLILAGLIAIFLPWFAGVAVTAMVGWLLLFAGVAHLIYGWHARGTGAVIWQLLIGILYLFVGGYLLVHPARGLLTLTLLLASYFVVEGIFELVTYFRLRRSRRAGWFLWDGLITLFLGILIWVHWPLSSVWALGTIVGISLLMSGITRLSYPVWRPVPGAARPV